MADHHEPQGIAAVYRDDERLGPLIGPGGPFEVEDVVLEGVPLRVFVRAPRTVVDAFELGVTHATRTQIVHEDERLTFAEVRARSLALARELQSSFGVRRGDRVAIAMRNLPEFVISFWGAALVGAIVVPLNSWWQGPELAYALQDAGAVVAFVDAERRDRVVADGRPAGLQLVTVRTEGGDDARFDELVRGAPLEDSAIARPEPDDPVTILYTSGTTGRPKGALGTHRGAIANIWNMAFGAARESLIAGRQSDPSVQPASLSAAPLFHIGGVAAIIGSPIGGSKLVLMRKWDVEEGLRLARRERVTGLGGVPAIARQILERPGVEQLGLAIRTFPLGGAAVPPDLPQRAVQRFGPSVQLLNGYGMTETTSAVVTNVGVEFEARPDSVGRPNLTADLRVIDPDGEELGAGEVGELCFRSPQVVKGYWNDESSTRASFDHGWFRSGDLGYVDADGYVYVVDRLKDVVIRGGENVYCAEVEAVLHEHPDVADVAVVGLEERAMGERVCAVVVPRPGVAVTLPDLRAFASTRLAAFKCPEALYLTDELPRTATEKVAKPELRARISAAADVDTRW
jgi:acyl-CoA synthetase (AMP-forming)/AMP-acid ligase II